MSKFLFFLGIFGCSILFFCAGVLTGVNVAGKVDKVDHYIVKSDKQAFGKITIPKFKKMKSVKSLVT